jgi:hypothetical protein
MIQARAAAAGLKVSLNPFMKTTNHLASIEFDEIDAQLLAIL